MRHPIIKAAALAATVALASTACGGSGGSDGRTVTFAAYGGDGQQAETDAWLDPFSEETGIEVVQDDPVTYAKIEQMVETGNVIWDVAQGGSDIGLTGNPILEDIDCEVVACEEFADGPFPAEQQGVPVFIFSVVLAYNTEKVSGTPTNWADFFDTETHPGKRAIDSSVGFRGMLEAALLADGVAREDLYPLDVDRALGYMEPLKDDLIAFEDATECINLVSSGEAVMGNCYNGRVTKAQEEGQPIDLAWGQQIYYCDYLFVPKGAPNKDEAMELIAHITSAENNGRIADHISYGPANPGAEVSEESLANSPTSNQLEGEDAPIVPDDPWWLENREEVMETVSEWLAS
ncbi:polyamine ABC transporter substrate-binding protein [Thermobifida halotolerans]|uniref:Polyamine ABC transporter substrate-binding protein n=1 Tax=Thermobifida halotolerans TaxID=483545 RepID=A0AA97LTU2_9ACTN|nr:ABC transporter substrate-binding protein [Thermobifida halotolerans]UOE17947.1 polyamine ABC transporter substrate-binding protein [Thermobifida halotolerans]